MSALRARPQSDSILLLMSALMPDTGQQSEVCSDFYKRRSSHSFSIGLGNRTNLSPLVISMQTVAIMKQGLLTSRIPSGPVSYSSQPSRPGRRDPTGPSWISGVPWGPGTQMSPYILLSQDVHMFSEVTKPRPSASLWPQAMSSHPGQLGQPEEEERSLLPSLLISPRGAEVRAMKNEAGHCGRQLHTWPG